MKSRLSLVTGGGGFIGLHLVRQLLERGDTVRVLELADAPLPDSVEVVRGSICDKAVVRKSLQGVQRLYHVAGNPNLWTRNKKDFYRVNLEGTTVVLNEAARHDLEVIVYTSTESILTGSNQDNTLVTDAVKRNLEEMPGPYCRSKFLAEQTAFQATRNGLPVVIVAPTLPVGPGDRLLTPPTQMILDFLNGRTPAYLECGLNLVDVRDVARGHILAAEKGRPGERYILGNQNMNLSVLLAMIEDITGLPMPKIPIPYWVALLAGFTMELIADYVTRRAPQAPLAGVRLARRPMFYDSNKAINELGFVQNSVYRALADEIAWLVREGLVDRHVPFLQQEG